MINFRPRNGSPSASNVVFIAVAVVVVVLLGAVVVVVLLGVVVIRFSFP